MTCRYAFGLSGLFIFLLSFTPCYALDFFSKNPGKLPIEIDSQHGITCQEKGRVCTARGHVVVTHGQTKMHCDVLTATFTLNEKGLPADLQRLEAQGNVRLSSKDRTKRGTAHRAVYDVDTGRARFTGGALSLYLDGLTVTADEALEYFEKEGRAVATGRARAQKEDKVISGQTLTAFFKQEGDDKGLTLKQVTAQGNVMITTPKSAAQGESALYTVRDDMVRLKDHVRLTRQEGQIEGEYAEMNLETGVARVLGSHDFGKEETGKKILSPSVKSIGGADAALEKKHPLKKGRVKVLLRSSAPSRSVSTPSE